MTNRFLTRTVWGAALFALAAMVGSPARAASDDQRVALVIGNGNYENAALPDAEKDARAMASALKTVGFDVSLLLDGNQSAMKRAIIKFGNDLEKGGIGLFYYAGHAVQMRQRNYMIPIDAQISVEEHVEPEAVDMLNVVSRMAGARNRLNIVILDASHQNPFRKTFRFYADGLAQTRAPAHSYIAYAAAPGEIGAEGDAGGSYYTEALVRYMRMPGLTIEEMFKKVRAQVMEATYYSQVPWTSSSMTGEFYFVPPTTSAIGRSRMLTPGPTVDHEVVFWQSIYNRNRAEDFEAYLAQFPDGLFATLARERLRELRPGGVDGSGGQAVTSQVGPKEDPTLFAKIDQAMEEAKAAGATHEEQIASASEKLRQLHTQPVIDKKTNEVARRAAYDEEKRKVQAEFKEMLVAARREAEAVESRTVADATQRADAAARVDLERTTKEAKLTAAKAFADARRTVASATKVALAAVEKEAETARKDAVVSARNTASEAYRTAMKEAEKEAEKVRQRILARAKAKADQEMALAVAEAERKAAKMKEAQLAAARRNVEQGAAKTLGAAVKRAKDTEAKALANAKAKADKVRSEVIARARQEATAESERQFTDAMKRAEHIKELRLAEIAKRLRDARRDEAPAPSASRSISSAQTNPPMVTRSIVLTDTPKRLATRMVTDDGETAAVSAGLHTVEASVDPKLRKVMADAMARARQQGASYQAQLRAALDAVKRVKGIENSSSRAEAPSAFGMAIDHPKLKRAIEAAIAEARARGQDYEGLSRAALGAIKDYLKKNKDRSAASQ